MKTIICLGPKACDIGELFEEYPNLYYVRLIDKDIEGDNCFSIAPQKTPEEYEKNTPNLGQFFSKITDEVVFITSGAADVANSSLRILQQIKDKKISIVYLTPFSEFLTNKQVMQERLIRGVLQEYTRSGLFEKMIIFDNSLVERVMGPSTIKDYDFLFNNTIKKALENHYALSSGELIIDAANAPKEVSRILSFGYYYLEQDQELALNNLNMIDDKIYHFYLSEQTLNNDVKLLNTIKENLKKKTQENTKVSYTIRKSPTNNNFCFVEAYTKVVQR